MFNKVILLGNLTKDVELRYTPNGAVVASSSIATSRKFNTNGEKKEEVCFIDVTFFGKTAEIANQYLKKGSKLLVEGRLKFDTWQDQNGQTRSKHSVVADTMQMLGNSQNSENTNYSSNSSNQNSFNQNSNSNFTQNESYNQAKKAVSKENSFTQNSFNEKNSYSKPVSNIDVNSDIYDDEEIPF